MAIFCSDFRATAAPGRALLLLAAAAIALSACVGGFGSGGGSGLHRGGHIDAAKAIPKAGSVTQSSVGSVTTARSVTGIIEESGGQLTLKISSQGWGFENVSPDSLPDSDRTVTINGRTWQVIEQSRTYGDGSKRYTRTYTDADPNSFDNDYLAMGYWLRVPQNYVGSDGELSSDYDLGDFMADIEYGVFVNGGDPYEQANILALTGTATYTGDATGVYIDTENDKNSPLRADVSITADFGDGNQLGTLSGTVSNFERYDDGPPGARELTDNELGQLGNVNLESADIGDSDSGFFTGDTSMTVNSDSLTGKWGGQFYGNDDNDPNAPPGGVAGTFGAASEGGDKVIVGTYAGRR